MYKKLKGILESTDGVLITSPHNMRYFSGSILLFFNWSGVILIAAILIKKAIAVCKIKK